MASSILPVSQYNYSQDEKLELLIHSVRGNRECKSERKNFNLCRSNLLGKYVEPNFCLEKATSLVNCYQNVRKDKTDNCKKSFENVFKCSKNYDSAGRFSFASACQQELNTYLEC